MYNHQTPVCFLQRKKNKDARQPQLSFAGLVGDYAHTFTLLLLLFFFPFQ